MSDPRRMSPPSPSFVPARVVAPPEPRWLVLVMLFVLMGALAVPMLRRSPHFSPRAKTVLSVVAFVQTALVLIIFAAMLIWFIERIMAIFAGR